MGKQILLLSLCIAALFSADAMADTVLVTDSAVWNANLVGGSLESFDTSAANLALSDELAAAPGSNDDIGSVLSFDSANTGLSRSFILSSVNVPATSPRGFTYSDNEGSLGGANHLSVGDVNGVAGSPTPTIDYEDDDFRVVTDISMTAFSFVLIGNDTNISESIQLFLGSSPVATLTGVPTTSSSGEVFIGILSTDAFDTIIFDEDRTGDGGDDVAIQDFQFAEAAAVPEPGCSILVTALGLVALRRRKR